eukprot:NODE_603_length_1503_cov_194.839752_g451_i0.p1 GENE.NODE_603_length_1503_cov_194.839752_g451_i0~~NODE_603_length_1503_cov_194.839752_g451_i0.p1  ORF type:complete len:231 (-),score=40.25 NODE_603_length_1503_cov_194.839752_g451_i0:170-862(-)
MLPEADDRNYSPIHSCVERNAGALRMSRVSGRGKDTRVGSAGVTPSSNREELNNLLKKVDRKLQSTNPLAILSLDTLPSSFQSKSTSDFYLGGGRSQGTFEEPNGQVLDIMADVDQMSVRVRTQLHQSQTRALQERKQRNRQKAQMNSQQMHEYRLSDEYKLTKNYKIYQDRELQQLQTELGLPVADFKSRKTGAEANANPKANGLSDSAPAKTASPVLSNDFAEDFDDL